MIRLFEYIDSMPPEYGVAFAGIALAFVMWAAWGRRI